LKDLKILKILTFTNFQIFQFKIKFPCINIIYSSVIIPNKQGSSVVVGLAVQMFIVADTPTMAQAATHIITAVVTHITAASMVACHPKLVS